MSQRSLKNGLAYSLSVLSMVIARSLGVCGLIVVDCFKCICEKRRMCAPAHLWPTCLRERDLSVWLSRGWLIEVFTFCSAALNSGVNVCTLAFKWGVMCLHRPLKAGLPDCARMLNLLCCELAKEREMSLSNGSGFGAQELAVDLCSAVVASQAQDPQPTYL